MFAISATRLVKDEGTVVVFAGREEDPTSGAQSDDETHFAVDHRMAQDIVGAIERDGFAEFWVEDWQVIGGRA